MNNIMLLGVLAAMMIFTVIIWAWSFWLSRDYLKNKKLLIINGLIGAGLLALSPLLLHFIDLPTSMLPQFHITDFPHYGRYFGELFGELNRLTEAGSEIAAAAIDHAKLSLIILAVVIVLGLVLGTAAIILEVVLNKQKDRKQEVKL